MTTVGLVLIWENNKQTNRVFDSERLYLDHAFRLDLQGHAKYGRFSELDLSGGAALAQNTGEMLLSGVKKTNHLSIEALVWPDNLKQNGPARIISFSSGSQSRNFTLGQDGDKLVLRLRTTSTGENADNPQIELGRLDSEKPQHVVVTYAPGELICYLNGQRVLTTDKISGDFSNWTAQKLIFGDEVGGGRGWDGKLEGVAIYNRVLSAEQAKQNYEMYTARLQNRQPAPRIQLEAKLIQATKVPTPQSIAPYRRALVVNEYQVEKVLDGKFDQPKILVAQWTIMDGKVLADSWKTNSTYHLTLENFEDHPQLQSERLVQDSEEFELKLFYAVAHAPVAPTNIAQATTEQPVAQATVKKDDANKNGPTADDLKALQELTAEISGAMLYTRVGRVKKIVLGELEATDLGPGEFARWSPDGKQIAVWLRGEVWVMNADGSERRKLVGGSDKGDGIPIEFHTNGREIIYWKRDSGFWTVPLDGGEPSKMDLPGVYGGEPGISADGKRMVARWGHDLYAIDLENKSHRKYTDGCSAGISPDGKRVMNNVGHHRELEIRTWDGSDTIKLDTSTSRPDRRWDSHHWSNHNDYFASQGEGNIETAYVVQISTNRITCVSWEGRVVYPDLFVQPKP